MWIIHEKIIIRNKLILSLNLILSKKSKKSQKQIRIRNTKSKYSKHKKIKNPFHFLPSHVLRNRGYGEFRFCVQMLRNIRKYVCL